MTKPDEFRKPDYSRIRRDVVIGYVIWVIGVLGIYAPRELGEHWPSVHTLSTSLLLLPIGGAICYFLGAIRNYHETDV